MMKNTKWISAGLAAVFALTAAAVFHALWAPDAILQASDGNIGAVAYNQRVVQSSLTSHWLGETLWGLPSMGGAGLHLWAVGMRFLSARAFMNGYYGFCLAVAAWFLALYLRDKGLRPAACVFGGLTAFWVGTNLTLVYAGHIGKFGVLAFLAAAVFALGRWGKTGRAAWAVVAGAAAGGMFLEQADVALFCALLLAPLGLYEASRAARGWNVAAIARKSWGAALAAALVAGGASISSIGAGVTDVPGGESAEQRWAFLTQWSQPPSESLDFIAPGWTGWRSGEASGPYWGKMGRDAGWEQTRQGFMNFKLENVYVGAIPLLFALMGLAAAFRRRREADAPSTEIFLWGGLCALALLLSFGKFFPLYRVLTWLPGFGSIRNPNKFIHFFQMAWGVLAAYGLDAALGDGAAAKRWRWAALAGAAVFLLAGAALWADLGAGGARLAAAGWGAAGRAIQWNKAFSVTYAGVALLAGAGMLWAFAAGVFHGVEKSFPQHGKNGEKFPQHGKKVSTAWKTVGPRWAGVAAWLPALAVAFDATAILAPKYIQTMPAGYVAENDLVRDLKRELGSNRTAMVSMDGIYNLWLSYLFPFHGISSTSVTQLPRPPADYKAFWEAVRDPLRSWRLTGVSHVLVRAEVAKQLMSNPDWARQLEVGWAYQAMDDGRGGVTTRRMAAGQPGPEVVLRLKPTPPRVAAVPSWRVVDDAEALRTLADPGFEPYRSALLAPGSEACAPPSGDPGAPPRIEISRLTPGRYEFTAETHAPTVVRVGEKYDPAWRATVDGEVVPVLRVDYMFQGIALEKPGRHEISMRYAPSQVPLLMQGAGLLAGLVAAGWLAAAGFVRRK